MDQWLAAYFLSLAIEMPIVLAAGAGLGWFGRNRLFGWPQAFVLAWVLNLTHPILWAIRPESWEALIAAEVLVVIAEGAALTGAVMWTQRRKSDVPRPTTPTASPPPTTSPSPALPPAPAISPPPTTSPSPALPPAPAISSPPTTSPVSTTSAGTLAPVLPAAAGFLVALLSNAISLALGLLLALLPQIV